MSGFAAPRGWVGLDFRGDTIGFLRMEWMTLARIVLQSPAWLGYNHAKQKDDLPGRPGHVLKASTRTRVRPDRQQKHKRHPPPRGL